MASCGPSVRVDLVTILSVTAEYIAAVVSFMVLSASAVLLSASGQSHLLNERMAILGVTKVKVPPCTMGNLYKIVPQNIEIKASM